MLTQEEIDQCREVRSPKPPHSVPSRDSSNTELHCSRSHLRTLTQAFERFDKDGSGTIDVWELKATLNGEPCNEPGA